MIPLGLYGAARPVASGGPVVLASDSFNRADGALNGMTTDSAYGGTSRTWYNNASYEVNSNELRSTSGLARWAALDIGVGDVAVSARVVTLSAFRLCARARTSDLRTERYAANIAGDGSVTLEIELGGVTTLGSAAASTVAAGDVVTLRCSGSSISVLVEGTPVISATDSTKMPGANDAFVGIQSNSSSWRLDDFKVEEA